MSNKSISFWLLVACGTLIGTTGAVSISNIDGTVVISGPDAQNYKIVQDGNRQIVSNLNGQVMSTFVSGGNGGVSMSSVSSSSGGGCGVGTGVIAGGGAGFAYNPAAQAVNAMMAGMGAGGAMAMAFA